LCAGSYFITLAIADAISHSDMLYLDRKTDVIIVKISQPRILASGIAMLGTVVNVSKAAGREMKSILIVAEQFTIGGLETHICGEVLRLSFCWC
jgi:uncharacterized membrane protein YadS